MRIIYDAAANTASVELQDIEPGGIKESIPLDTLEGSPRLLWGIILDFDGDGRLVGFEVEDAEGQLPPAALAAAQRPPS